MCIVLWQCGAISSLYTPPLTAKQGPLSSARSSHLNPIISLTHSPSRLLLLNLPISFADHFPSSLLTHIIFSISFHCLLPSTLDYFFPWTFLSLFLPIYSALFSRYSFITYNQLLKYFLGCLEYSYYFRVLLSFLQHFPSRFTSITEPFTSHH